jgi:hypothetical protein
MVQGWDPDRFACPGQQDDRGVDLDDLVSDAVGFLTDDEAKVFRLVYEHRRRPSDLAVMLDMGSLQNASKRAKRILELAAYYCRHMPAIRAWGCLIDANGGPLSRQDAGLLWACVVGRRSIRSLALEYGTRRSDDNRRMEIHRRLKRAREAIEGLPDFATMVDDYFGGCYFIPTRRDLNMETWRERVRGLVMSLVGRVWYVWGGGGGAADRRPGVALPGLKPQPPFEAFDGLVADCSGLVLEVFKEAGVLPASWQDMGARAIARMYRPVASPQPGDLAFYGKTWPELGHVMICVGDVAVGPKTIPGAVAGMTGGDSTFTDPAWSRIVGAGLWIRKAAYRRDLLGYRRVEPKGVDA